MPTLIGTKPEQVPANGMLGTAAFVSIEQIQAPVLNPPASSTPAANGSLAFELTSNTALTVKVRGSDGVVRSAVLTLA